MSECKNGRYGHGIYFIDIDAEPASDRRVRESSYGCRSLGDSEVASAIIKGLAEAREERLGYGAMEGGWC